MFNRNYGSTAVDCSSTLFSYYSLPLSTCVADSTENYYVTSKYSVTNDIVSREMYTDYGCTSAPSLRSFPAINCASLPSGDYFSQKAT